MKNIILNNYFKKELLKFATARIDLKNVGSSSNKIKVNKLSDKNANIKRPPWFKNNNGEGVVISSYHGTMDIEIECKGSGELNINLRGIDFKDKNNIRFPIYIQYNTLLIDGKDILNKNRVVWHNKPFKFKKKVNDGEKVFIYIEWEPISKKSDMN